MRVTYYIDPGDESESSGIKVDMTDEGEIRLKQDNDFIYFDKKRIDELVFALYSVTNDVEVG